MTLFSSSKADLWGSFLLYLFIHTGTQMALLGITKIRPSSFVNLHLKLPFFILSFVYSFQNNLKTTFIPPLRWLEMNPFRQNIFPLFYIISPNVYCNASNILENYRAYFVS